MFLVVVPTLPVPLPTSRTGTPSSTGWLSTIVPRQTVVVSGGRLVAIVKVPRKGRRKSRRLSGYSFRPKWGKVYTSLVPGPLNLLNE